MALLVIKLHTLPSATLGTLRPVPGKQASVGLKSRSPSQWCGSSWGPSGGKARSKSKAVVKQTHRSSARAWKPELGPRSEGRGHRAEAPPPAPAPPAAPRPSAATLGSSWSRGAWSRGARRPAVSGVPASPAARPHVRHVSSHLFPGVWEQGS